MTSRARLGLAAASVGLLVGLAWRAGLARLVEAIGRTDPATYVVALAVFASTYVLIALRWQALQRAVDAELDLLASFEITAVSYGLNKLLPGNLGDVVRSKLSERYVEVESHAGVLGLVAAERAADVATVAAVVVVTPWAATGLGRVGAVTSTGLVALSLVGALAVVLAAVRPGALAGRVPDRFARPLDEGLAAVDALPAGTLGLVSALSLVRWLVVAAAFQLLARAIGLELAFPVAAFVVAAMGLAAAVPLAPGGLGTVDAAGTGLLVLVGVGYAPALTLVLLQRSLGLGLMAAVGVAVYAYRAVVPPGRA